MSFFSGVFLCVDLAVLSLTGCASRPLAVRDCCRPAVAPAVASGLMVPGTTNSLLDIPALWQTDEGKDFHLSELRGHNVLISMFYANCQGVCLITKEDLKGVEASLPATVRAQTVFVLVTLDPDRETAAVLSSYRAEAGLARQRWWLLRGSARATAELAMQLNVGYGFDHAGLFRHSSEITLLDRSGKIVLQRGGIHADLAEITQQIMANH